MRAVIIVTACVGVFVGGAIAFHQYTKRNYVQPAHDLSKMITVRNIAESALTDHYKQHGSYPRSFSDLPLQTLKWGDEGSSAQDLNNWRYNSDGESFTMTWTSTRDVKLFLGARKGLVFYSENEMQR